MHPQSAGRFPATVFKYCVRRVAIVWLLTALGMLGFSRIQAAPVRVFVAAESQSFRTSLESLLRQRGATVDSAADIDSAKLQNADVLVLQSSQLGARSGAPRAALESFGRRGGGILVLNGAVGTGEPEWWKPLVGGAWSANSRKFTSRMMLYIAQNQHAIVKGASSFDIDDDTIYDLDLDTNITVLASAFTPKTSGGRRGNRGRPATDGPERANIYDLQPQIWTYEAPAPAGGKAHRAFTMLPGAPATLNHTSYLTFMFRAISWVAGRESLDELCSREEIAALMYPVGGPLRAEDTAKQFQLHPDFQVNVVASEPLINKPIAIQWDERGRLWVAETPEYPNGRRPSVAEPWKETGSPAPGRYDRPATDRISILSNPDAQGRFTKKTVFYEGLELVTGFCFYKDGIIVIHNPDILWIRDTNGDGQGDKVERIFTGFTPGDTHFVANHFILAPDGWVYVSMGGAQEARNPKNNQSMGRVTSGMFRFKPDGSAIEQVSSKGGNGFGADVTSDFELFYGQATSGNPIQHVVLPEKVLARGNVGSPGSANSVNPRRRIVIPKPQDRVALMQIDVVGGYSAGCASLVYEGGAWPDEWAQSVFCTEPLVNIVHHEILRPTGPTFTGEMVRRDAEFILSPDYWFRPIEVALGPDGALYILDFYSPVIAHNDTRGPQHSRSGASVRPDRDHYFGRIYRVQHKNAKKLEVPDLSRASQSELVKTLSHPNRTVRRNAQRLLVDRGGAAAVRALGPVAQSAKFTPARILALWSLNALGTLQPQMLSAAFHAQEPEVRKNAALIAEANGGKNISGDLQAALNDSDPRVRLATLRAMAAGGLDEKGAAALFALFPRLEDNWSKSAAVAAASGNPSAALRAALNSERPNDFRDLVASIANRFAEQQNPAAFADLVRACAAAPDTSDAVKQIILSAGAKQKSMPTINGELIAALRKLLSSPNPALSAAALPLAVAWDTSGALRPEISRNVTPLIGQLNDTKLPEARREQIAQALVGARNSDPAVLSALRKLLADANPDSLKRGLIAALAAAGDAPAGAMLVSAYPSLSTTVQDAAFEALLARADWTKDFLSAIRQKTISISLLGPSHVFRLRSHPSSEVVRQAEELFQSAFQVSPDKEALVAKLLPEVSKPGNLAKGKELFTANCAVCHKFGDQGADVGPMLTGMGVHGPESLLIHIVDPNRQVDGGYEAWNFETSDGETYTGIIASENASRVVLKRSGSPLEIPVSTIKSRADTRKSLMPEGLEVLGAERLRDIIAYLIGEGSRFRVLNLANAFTADTRRGLYQSAEALDDTLPFRRFGIVDVEGVPFNIVNPASVKLGGNVIVLKGGTADSFASKLPKHVEIPVGYPVNKFHFLGGVAGWGGQARDDGPTAMTVTMLFTDGQRHEVALRQGDVFVDYIAPIDAPGSKLAEGLTRGKQVRWFTLPVPRKVAVAKLILESPGQGPAPTTVAITADLSEAPIPGAAVVGSQAPPSTNASGTASASPPAALTWESGIKVLIVGGGSSHDFQRWFNTADVAILRAAGGFSVNYTESSAVTAKALEDSDVVVSSTNQRGFDTPELRAAWMKFADAGKGILLLHPAVWYNWPWPDYNRLFVGGGSRSHDAIHEFDVNILKEHPVTMGLPKTFKAVDELYHVNADTNGAPIEVLAQTSVANNTKKEHPSIWLVNHPKARIVGIALGHDGRVHDLPEWKRLLVNAVNWASRKKD